MPVANDVRVYYQVSRGEMQAVLSRHRGTAELTEFGDWLIMEEGLTDYEGMSQV